jgi:raffinose/stachyose/melibiose transport system permease protein
MRVSSTERTMNYVILVGFSLIALAPMVAILLTAFHPPGSVTGGFSLPTSLNTDTFTEAWRTGHFSAYMRSSAIVAVTVVAATTIFSILAGYAFGTMRFPLDGALFYLMLAGLVVPFESMIVPLYYDFRDLGLTDTYWALILPQVGLSVSFGTFWMRAYFRTVPKELLEAARVDGASSWRTLWRILVPSGRPAIVTMMLIVFMWTWNEFLLALVMVSQESLRTAPLGLSYFQGRFGTDIASLAAASVIVAAPVLVLYIFLQRHFISGMLAGALKQ